MASDMQPHLLGKSTHIPIPFSIDWRFDGLVKFQYIYRFEANRGV